MAAQGGELTIGVVQLLLDVLEALGERADTPLQPFQVGAREKAIEIALCRVGFSMRAWAISPSACSLRALRLS